MGATATAQAAGASTTPQQPSAGLPAAATLASGLAEGYSTLQAGKYNARIARMNAAYDTARSQRAVQQGEFGVNALRLQGRKIIGEQRAGYAAGNISVDTGTAVDVAKGTDAAIEADAHTIRENAQLQAWGFDVSAADSRAKAQLDLAAAKHNAEGIALASSSKAGRIYSGLKDGG